MDRIAFNLINGIAQELEAEGVRYGVGYQLVVRLLSDLLARAITSAFNQIWPTIANFLRPSRDIIIESQIITNRLPEVARYSLRPRNRTP